MIREVSYGVWAYRAGAAYKRLKAVSPPSITCKKSASIKTSFTGKFLSDPDVNYLSDSIRPFLYINKQPFPLGVYKAGNIARSKTSQGFIDTVDAYDGCYLLTENKTTDIMHFSSGELYTGIVAALLQQSGVELATVVNSSAGLREDREDWEVGTPMLTIANALLKEIVYDDIWFDADGRALVIPTVEASANNIKHTYSSRSAHISRGYTSSTDIFNIPNVFTVVCSNPDFDSPMHATVENTSMGSPTSIPNRGMRIVKTYLVNNIASQKALEEYAQTLKYNSMMASQTISIETDLEPNHGVGDIVALDIDEHQGIYIEEGWSMTLGPGKKMKHTLRRVMYG